MVVYKGDPPRGNIANTSHNLKEESGKTVFSRRTIIISQCMILNLKMSFLFCLQISYVQLECKAEAYLTV